jgi:hypothetical protein
MRFIRGLAPLTHKYPSVEERFCSKVDTNGPVHPILQTACWLWGGPRHGFGYGRIRYNKRDISAHRCSYILNNGPIPDDLWVLHHCDNPACVNPDHLFLGTRQDNIDDMIAKNRHRQGHSPAGESNPSAKLTEPEVLRIRELAAQRVPRQQLGDMYGVSLPLIEKIISRSVWSHI